MVVKRDGRREPFRIEKLERGFQRALEKRPISQSVIEETLHDLEDEVVLHAKTSREILAVDLGEMVLRKLYPLDRVAYIRFASVYRRFEDVDEFIREIERLSP